MLQEIKPWLFKAQYVTSRISIFISTAFFALMLFFIHDKNTALFDIPKPTSSPGLYVNQNFINTMLVFLTIGTFAWGTGMWLDLKSPGNIKKARKLKIDIDNINIRTALFGIHCVLSALELYTFRLFLMTIGSYGYSHIIAVLIEFIILLPFILFTGFVILITLTNIIIMISEWVDKLFLLSS